MGAAFSADSRPELARVLLHGRAAAERLRRASPTLRAVTSRSLA